MKLSTPGAFAGAHFALVLPLLSWSSQTPRHALYAALLGGALVAWGFRVGRIFERTLPFTPELHLLPALLGFADGLGLMRVELRAYELESFATALRIGTGWFGLFAFTAATIAVIEFGLIQFAGKDAPQPPRPSPVSVRGRQS